MPHHFEDVFGYGLDILSVRDVDVIEAIEFADCDHVRPQSVH